MSEVNAKLNGLRIAPRKVRAVVNLLKGKNVVDALGQLEYMIKKPSVGLIKLLNSAIANAENNFSMVKENLYIKRFIVNEGVKLKRFRAKGFGRAAAIQKKTSHIEVVLDEREPGLKRSKAKVQEAKVKETGRDESKKTNQGDDKKPEIKREIGSKRGVISQARKLFQRKSV